MAQKLLIVEDGAIKEREVITTSAGAADAGKVVGLGADGKFDASVLPSGGSGSLLKFSPLIQYSGQVDATFETESVTLPAGNHDAWTCPSGKFALVTAYVITNTHPTDSRTVTPRMDFGGTLFRVQAATTVAAGASLQFTTASQLFFLRGGDKFVLDASDTSLVALVSVAVWSDTEPVKVIVAVMSTAGTHTVFTTPTGKQRICWSQHAIYYNGSGSTATHSLRRTVSATTHVVGTSGSVSALSSVRSASQVVGNAVLAGESLADVTSQDTQAVVVPLLELDA